MDDTEVQQSEPEEVSQPQEPPQEASESADDLESLLAEFDQSRGVQSPDEAEPEAQDAPEKSGAPNAYEQAVEGLLLDRMQQQEQADANRAIERARESVDDIEGLPEDYPERWLRAEYLTNPELADAWDRRGDSEAAMERLDRVLSRTLKGLRKSAQSIPDRDATADRYAVTAAVRGASKAAPQQQEINRDEVANMSDAQFEKWVRDQGRKVTI